MDDHFDVDEDEFDVHDQYNSPKNGYCSTYVLSLVYSGAPVLIVVFYPSLCRMHQIASISEFPNFQNFLLGCMPMDSLRGRLQNGRKRDRERWSAKGKN